MKAPLETGSATPAARARFELRYRSLSPHRCSYAFPCDENGRVDVQRLSAEARENYAYASAMVGSGLLHPQVLMSR